MLRELRAALRCAGSCNEHKWCRLAARIFDALRDAACTGANYTEYVEARRALTVAYKTPGYGAPTGGVGCAHNGGAPCVFTQEHPGY
jgi:hypothetical protein